MLPMDDIQKSFDEMKKKSQTQRIIKHTEDSAKASKDASEDFKKIEGQYYDLLKNVTILSGTIFASSIALATGRNVSYMFLTGEFFLLVSTLFGGIFLWAQLKGREWLHFHQVKFHLQEDLVVNKDIMHDFVVKATQETINSYDKLMNQKTLPLDYFLRIVKIDWIPSITLSSFFIGLILLWLSLLNNTPAMQQPATPTYFNYTRSFHK